jgi:hypothetical protein
LGHDHGPRHRRRPRRHNEHLVVVPKLVYAANYLLTSGSNTGLIVCSIVLAASCSVLLVYFARDLLRDTPWRLGACAVLVPLAMFSAKLGDNYYRGMSGVTWFAGNLFVILSAAALAKAIVSGRPAWLFASLLTGLLGMLSNNAAIYSLLVPLGACLAFVLVPRFRSSIPVAALVAVATLVVMVLGLGFVYRNASASHLTLDPIALVRFVLTLMGNTLTMGTSKLQALMAPLVGFVILAMGALSIYRLGAKRRIGDALLWIILFFYALQRIDDRHRPLEL